MKICILNQHARTHPQTYTRNKNSHNCLHLLHFHHAGAVAFDKMRGFWMVSSVPKFPPPRLPNGFHYRGGQTTYGQTVLCVTIQYAFKSIIRNSNVLLFLFSQSKNDRYVIFFNAGLIIFSACLLFTNRGYVTIEVSNLSI